MKEFKWSQGKRNISKKHSIAKMKIYQQKLFEFQELYNIGQIIPLSQSIEFK